MNLLSLFPERPARFSYFLARKDDWQIIRGIWARKPDSRVVLNAADTPAAGESMSLIGDARGDVDLRARFKFLTGTIRPPDKATQCTLPVRFAATISSTQALAAPCTNSPALGKRSNLMFGLDTGGMLETV